MAQVAPTWMHQEVAQEIGACQSLVLQQVMGTGVGMQLWYGQASHITHHAACRHPWSQQGSLDPHTLENMEQ